MTAPHITEIAWDGTPTADAAGLSALLSEVEQHIQRYVVMTADQACASSLWTAHTHVIGAFEYTPYFSITSATKRSGKSILLECLDHLTPRPWLTGRTSPAALVRKVNALRPTLLLDESDTAFNGEKEYAEALRGILNTGFKVTGKTTLCVGQGANLTYQDFSTFCAKAIAGIGKLPDTVADRSIPIVLRRRLRTEAIERFRGRDVRALAAPLAQRLVDWGKTALSALREARPALPDLLHDRAADVWEPLLAIADLAGGGWPMRARTAALALMGTLEDRDVRVELLEDIAAILAEDGEDDEPASEMIGSSALQQALVALEDRPWPTWSQGKPMTPHKLARMLADFGIHPRKARLKTVNKPVQAYRREALSAVCARYLPMKVEQWNIANNDGPEVAISDRNTVATCSGLKNAVSPITTGLCSTVPLSNPDQQSNGGESTATPGAELSGDESNDGFTF